MEVVCVKGFGSRCVSNVSVDVTISARVNVSGVDIIGLRIAKGVNVTMSDLALLFVLILLIVFC